MKNLAPHRTLDCRGDACPLPLLKTKKAMAELASGEILEVLGTDPGSKNDLPSWASLSREREAAQFSLYPQPVDYDRLLELILTHDRVISWW